MAELRNFFWNSALGMRAELSVTIIHDIVKHEILRTFFGKDTCHKYSTCIKMLGMFMQIQAYTYDPGLN